MELKWKMSLSRGRTWTGGVTNTISKYNVSTGTCLVSMHITDVQTVIQVSFCKLVFKRNVFVFCYLWYIRVIVFSLLLGLFWVCFFDKKKNVHLGNLDHYHKVFSLYRRFIPECQDILLQKCSPLLFQKKKSPYLLSNLSEEFLGKSEPHQLQHYQVSVLIDTHGARSHLSPSHRTLVI